MFALFFSLYLSMFRGTWSLLTWSDIFTPGTTNSIMKASFKELGLLLTSIFGDGNYDALGQYWFGEGSLMYLVSFVLALITSIGIVVMAVKGIKRVFGVFFMGLR